MWPSVTIYMRSVFGVSAADALKYLDLPTSTWITTLSNNIDLVAGVWGTVTGREGTWYRAIAAATFYDLALDGSAVPMPSTQSAQSIGSGAMRGLLWQVRVDK